MFTVSFSYFERQFISNAFTGVLHTLQFLDQLDHFQLLHRSKSVEGHDDEERRRGIVRPVVLSHVAALWTTRELSRLDCET